MVLYKTFGFWENKGSLKWYEVKYGHLWDDSLRSAPHFFSASLVASLLARLPTGAHGCKLFHPALAKSHLTEPRAGASWTLATIFALCLQDSPRAAVGTRSPGDLQASVLQRSISSLSMTNKVTYLVGITPPVIHHFDTPHLQRKLEGGIEGAVFCVLLTK